ncbi:MAG: anti-sigma factor antagonist, partial [Chlorobium sp.]|nr:anti-sigma factor antagonist [Chlorobium sp.]
MKHSVSNRKELTILKIEEEVFDFRHGSSYRKTLEDLIENGN